MLVKEIFEYNLPPVTKTTVVVKTKPDKLTRFQKIKKAAQDLDIARKQLAKNPFESIMCEEALPADHLEAAAQSIDDTIRNIGYGDAAISSAQHKGEYNAKNKDDVDGVVYDLRDAISTLNQVRAVIVNAAEDMSEISKSTLDEATKPLDLKDFSLEDAVEKLESRFAAARRGLGLANRLKGEEKKLHLSAIMRNMNVIRNQLGRIISHLESIAA